MYIVIELQKSADGSVASIVTNHENFNQAESNYYSCLAAAAISSVPRHAVVMLQDNGMALQSKYYDHPEV